jgi:hypothetical protein
MVVLYPMKAVTKVSILSLFLFSSTVAACAKPLVPPSVQQVKKMFEASFVDNSYGSRRESIQINGLSCGSARQGNWYTDGIPAGTATMVIPCKISWSKTVVYAPIEGSRYSLDAIYKTIGKYNFFYDDVGDYVFKSGQVSQYKCDASGGNC